MVTEPKEGSLHINGFFNRTSCSGLDRTIGFPNIVMSSRLGSEVGENNSNAFGPDTGVKTLFGRA